MRSTLFALAVAASIATLPLPAPAAGNAALNQMWRSFATVKSFHAEMKLPQNRSISMDMVMPDKMHETMFGGMQMIVIGSDMWMERGGRWMKMPVAMPQFRRMLDSARTMGMHGKPPVDYTVTDLGRAMLAGAATEHYRLVAKGQDPVEMWVGLANHLPAQVVVQSASGPTTIVYSNYNGVPDITPPM